MDSLDERLYKLNLSTNKYAAAAHNHVDTNEFVQQQQHHHSGGGAAVVDSIPGGKVTHLVQQLQQQQQHQTANDVLHQQQHQQQQQHRNQTQTQQQLKGVGIGGSGGGGGVGGTAISSEAFQMKKVGPLVPPKPNKKKSNVQTLTYNNNNINENVENTQECLYETAANACSLPPTTTTLAKGKLINSSSSSGNEILNSQQHEHEKQQQPLQHHNNNGVLGRGPRLLHCKAQTLCTAAGSNCAEKSFNSKITLDIPIVLDQQLEALTHHKMQLEKRGLLQQQQQQSPQWKQTHKLSQQQQQQQQLHSNNLLNNIPKLSSTSLLAKDANVSIYTNLPAVSATAAATITPTTAAAAAAMGSPTVASEDFHKPNFKALQQQQHQQQQDRLSNCYTNLPLQQQQQQQQLYTNLLNHQQQSKTPILTTLPTLKTLHLADLSANSAQQLIRKHNNVSGAGDDDDDDDDVDDEEIPPPPSPVSSSYSELRRATTTTNNTNLFNIMPTVATTTAPTTTINQQYATGLKQLSQQQHTGVQQQQQQLQQQNEQNHYALDSSKMQNPYMNVHYTNDYNNSYSPTLQSLSQTSTDYYGYSSFSQGTSTYESIYEPINLRPTSQMSLTHSSNSLAYGSCSGGGGGSGVGGSGGYQLDGKNQLYKNQEPYENRLHQHQQNAHDPHNHSHHHHGTLRQQANQQQPAEAEVEALSDFLVHSMQQTNKLNNVDIDDDADDVDEHEHNPHDENYGICHKCNERILGETSGCTAMDQTYHIACFTCSQCQSNLQGKPFYALDGKPYCEYDYLQTLEKCSVCMKPILERILRATGKPYHPQCFTCIVCNKSLDGIPFTVDATNQNYCIADFHKKFAPRCCVCKEPIMPAAGEEETVRVVALDRSFHFECYKCEDCGLLLSSEADGRGCYPLDDHVLCKSCNANRVQMLTNRMTTEL